jgi:hypothetical protein
MINLDDVVAGDDLTITDMARNRITGPGQVLVGKGSRTLAVEAFGTVIPVAHYRFALNHWVPAKGVKIVAHQPGLV